jgi:hypothetical protein
MEKFSVDTSAISFTADWNVIYREFTYQVVHNEFHPKDFITKSETFSSARKHVSHELERCEVYVYQDGNILEIVSEDEDINQYYSYNSDIVKNAIFREFSEKEITDYEDCLSLALPNFSVIRAGSNTNKLCISLESNHYTVRITPSKNGLIPKNQLETFRDNVKVGNRVSAWLTYDTIILNNGINSCFTNNQGTIDIYGLYMVKILDYLIDTLY